MLSLQYLVHRLQYKQVLEYWQRGQYKIKTVAYVMMMLHFCKLNVSCKMQSVVYILNMQESAAAGHPSVVSTYSTCRSPQQQDIHQSWGFLEWWPGKCERVILSHSNYSPLLVCMCYSRGWIDHHDFRTCILHRSFLSSGWSGWCCLMQAYPR